jgi:predicted transcriptional regulator of viral defense system
MIPLETFLDSRLSIGHATFTKAEALGALGQSSPAFLAATERLIKKQRLVSPKRGFYIILRPEDRIVGAPEPARWIGPLMHHLGIDYRISLLRAAAFHGSSHQAAMVFQVIAPKQIRPIVIGRHNVQFVYQDGDAFAAVNQAPWLDVLKTDTGFTKIAGIELTLLDCARYFHKASGINGLAQFVRDAGGKAAGGKLSDAAKHYENSAVRRLGYLLHHFGHRRQAHALLPYAAKAKSLKPLDPSVKSLAALSSRLHETDSTWKLILNEFVETDT